jgi:ribonucleoside-triphosphate reductase
MEVTKRDGRKVEFNRTKITDAIIKAMERTDNGINREIALSISNKIAHTIEDSNIKKISVESIQDIVEDKLMASSRKDVAKEYITYRQERTRVRNLNKELYQKTHDIISCSNIDNNNANIDQYSFSGRENRVGSELHKQYAKDNLLTESVKKAFEDGYIYIHDFDKYAIGSHNCLFADVGKLLKEGFSTRNGDVRGANSIATAFQLIAVIFQIQSQVQFGGVASAHIDYDIAPYVKKSFVKHYKDGMKYISHYTDELIQETINNGFDISLNSENAKAYESVYQYAYDMTYREGMQGAQALYHNLNTLESRAGAQVPFTSINYGRDTSKEGQLVTEWLLKASIDGIGKVHKTSIFPIAIFQYKKGINDKEGTPNYYLKKLAIQSMTKRFYPNWVNCDSPTHLENPDDIDTIKATMGCRTQLGFDRHGLGYKQVGRGNICPTTIILPKIGIEYGICQGKRKTPDIEGFWKALDNILDITRESLLNRFSYICNQSLKSAPFMYDNGTIADYDKCEDNVYNAMKHGTLGFGFIGIAEMCQALFGTNFVHDKKVYNFALSVVKHVYDYAKASSEKYNLNFSTYATPAENLCKTSVEKLKKEYGSIPFVTDKKYLTNSSHVPVWEKVSMEQKLELEAPFTQYETAGCITYLELDSKLNNNQDGVEKIIDRMMELGIPYGAINFPSDICLDCGYQGEIENNCPICHSQKIWRIARVTGYLSSDVSNFNEGKQAEVVDRVDHNFTVDFGGDNN